MSLRDQLVVTPDAHLHLRPVGHAQPHVRPRRHLRLARRLLVVSHARPYSAPSDGMRAKNSQALSRTPRRRRLRLRDFAYRIAKTQAATKTLRPNRRTRGMRN